MRGTRGDSIDLYDQISSRRASDQPKGDLNLSIRALAACIYIYAFFFVQESVHCCMPC